MKLHLTSLASLFLCLCLGCTNFESAPKTTPTERAKLQGVIDDGVTLLDSSRLQAGIGAIDSDAPREFQTTESGIQYRILRKSDGKKPTAEDSVTVHYRGWLDNGREFDSSYDRDPSSFALTGVITGWTEGIQLVGTGGMIELWIPSVLGYGAVGSVSGGIPADAALHFVVELKSID